MGKKKIVELEPKEFQAMLKAEYEMRKKEEEDKLWCPFCNKYVEGETYTRMDGLITYCFECNGVID